MKTVLKKMLGDVRGASSMIKTVVEVAIVCTLLPVIATFIASTQNLTTIERTILGLTTTFIVIALVYGIVKENKLA